MIIECFHAKYSIIKVRIILISIDVKKLIYQILFVVKFTLENFRFMHIAYFVFGQINFVLNVQ